MSKVIGRYKSIASGNIYDFIEEQKAIVIDTGEQKFYQVGQVVDALITYKSDNYIKVIHKNLIGGDIL